MIKIGDRVIIHTATGGCYHKKTGTVVRILNGAMTPIDLIPYGSADAFPYWYRVRFDTPADNGGKPVEEEIFLGREIDLV